MLEITKKILTLEPEELIELERIITDRDYLSFVVSVIFKLSGVGQTNTVAKHIDFQ